MNLLKNKKDEEELMEKEIIHHDFEYYERTIEKIYKDYYKKMFILFGFFLILVGIISYLRGLKTLESLIIFLSLIEIIFIVKKYNELPLFLEKEKKLVQSRYFLKMLNITLLQ